MLLASADFASIHASVSGIPAMLALVWSIFLLIPGGIVVARLLVGSRSALPVKTARNGRLYCCVAGRPPVWARRGETASQLSLRCAGL